MNYLLDSQPLLLIPELAKAIGINEALVLQQVHYWLKKSPNIIDGRPWVYNTIDQWHEQFFFMSLSTLKRTFQSLHEKNILIKNNSFNKMKMDKTNWYSIDYEEFKKIIRPLGQIEPSIGSNCTIPLGQIELMDKVKMNHTITREYTETTTDIKTIQKKSASPKATLDSFDQFWESYPRKTAKANAQKSWAKIKPDDIPEIMAGLEKYKRCKQWQDVNYIPHAATWLNGKRWTDEVITVVDRHTLPDRNDYDEGTKLTPEQKARIESFDNFEDSLDGLF